MRWLAPAGALYGQAAALRARLYRKGLLPQARLAGPVISVGNLSLGGSGKTPVVVRIAQILMEHGVPVAILSRGYGGSFDGECLVVADGRTVLADARRAGDEPSMMARCLPGVVVAVGPKRDVVGRAVEERFGPRVHVLDDGFQHLRLARDLDVVCVRPDDLLDRPLPAGRLRESPSALSRANVVLAVDDPGGIVGKRVGTTDVYRTSHRVEGFFDRDGHRAEAPRRPFLVSGIARPQRFEDDVRARTQGVAGALRFADHHAFSDRDVATIVRQAQDVQADAVVTTAKDAGRLPEGSQLAFLVLRIAAQIEDEGRFRERLLVVARRAP